MLLLSKSLLNQAILSLQTGGQLAEVTGLIINPNNLKIEGFYCQDRRNKKRLILLTQEVRDIMQQGIVVNDHAALSEPEELVRLQDIIGLQFELIGKSVVTTTKQRLGKVNDFAADSTSLYIQKLYVSQSLMKSLSGGQLSVDRNNIVEITNRKIVIDEILKPAKSAIATSVLPAA